MKRYNPVAGLPIDPNGYCGDALGRVLHDGDFAGTPADQTRRRLPEPLVRRHPLVVVQAAEPERVVGKLPHGVGRRLTERSDSGVVQIDERLGHRELVAIPLVNFGTHSLDYTSNSAMRLPSTRMLAAATLLLCGVSPAKDKKKDPNEIGNRDVGKGINFYSIEKEIALGKQLAEEVRRQSKLVDDPIIGEYVNRLGQNLVRNSDATIPFTFQIVEGEQLNAFALPGGFVFVNTGLIEATETEAELAGAMAHEIAHVAARHITRQASRGKIVDLASLPLILLGGGVGRLRVRQASQSLIPMGFLTFSRGFESEADMLGLQYMYKAGYDPTASIDLFERMLSLEKRKPGIIAKVFNTHPMTGDRIVKTQKNIDQMLAERPEFVVTTSEFNEVRDRLEVPNTKKTAAKDKKKDPDEIGNRDVGKGVNFYSIEKEIALGKQLAQEVERQAKIVDDPVIAEYVNRVGQNLVRNSDAKVPFTIKVLDAEEINAFALPGGFFFVNTGVMLNADSEAELAGVMAHEIAHVAARHGTRQATRGQIINYASIPLIFMGGWTGYAIRQGAGLPSRWAS